MWRLVGVCAFANLLNQADRVILPIAVIPMTETFKWSLAERGLVLSAFAYGYIVSQFLGAVGAQVVGGRRLLLLSVVCWSLSILAVPTVASISLMALFVTQMLMGFFEGLCLPCVFQLLGENVSPDVRGQAFAVTAGGGTLGYIAALLLCPLLEWAAMYHVWGSLGAVWCAAWFVGLPSEASSSAPDQSLKEQKSQFDLSTACQYIRAFSKCRQLLAICAAHFSQNYIMYTMMAWLPTYLHEQYGVEKKHLGLTALPYMALCISQFAFGPIADHLVQQSGWGLVNVRRLMTVTSLAGPGAMLLLIPMQASAAGAIACLTLAFFFGGASAAGYQANHADIAPQIAGLTFALSNTIATLPGLIAGPLTAYIVASFSWAWVFTVASIINFVGSVVYVHNAGATEVLQRVQEAADIKEGLHNYYKVRDPLKSAIEGGNTGNIEEHDTLLQATSADSEAAGSGA